MIKFSKKIIFIILVLIIFTVITGYLIWGKNKSFKNNFYIVKKQNVVQEISVAGKVKPLENINLSFEKTGVLVSVFVETGQKVQRGTLLAQLDTRDAEKKVKDSEVNLENAKLALEKMNLQKNQLLRGDILNKNYEEGISLLAAFYSDTNTILNSLDNILFGNDLDKKVENIKYYVSYDNKFSDYPERLLILYRQAEKLNEEGLTHYQLAERGSGNMRDKAIRSAYDLAVELAEIIKLSRDIIRHFQDIVIGNEAIHEKESIINDHANTLLQHDLTIENYLKNLITIINAINNYYDTKESLLIDIKTQEMIVKQRENELLDAKNNLAKYFLYSPVDGLISRQTLKVGEIITAYVPVIELISDSRIEIVADIYEQDITKITKGSLVQISLPALPRQVFEGKVIFIEPTEKIIDGVVYYEIKVVFSKDLPKGIKPGMTADIIIETEKRENVLTVPREAVKRVGGKNIVEVFAEDLIQTREVELGLKSNEAIEVISGLSEGEKIIIR